MKSQHISANPKAVDALLKDVSPVSSEVRHILTSRLTAPPSLLTKLPLATRQLIILGLLYETTTQHTSTWLAKKPPLDPQHLAKALGALGIPGSDTLLHKAAEHHFLGAAELLIPYTSYQGGTHPLERIDASLHHDVYKKFHALLPDRDRPLPDHASHPSDSHLWKTSHHKNPNNRHK